MNLLVVDTALNRMTVAVSRDGVVTMDTEDRARGHQEALAPRVQSVMRDAGLDFAQLDAVGVTVGPGSFTGLRVGLAFAQGLGAALDRPVVGLSTLDALAASLVPDGRPVCAVIDGRRGQAYARLYDADGAPLDAAGPLSWDVLFERLAGIDGPGRLVGPGAELALAPGWTAQPLAGPTPRALLDLTARALASGRIAPPRPQYLRAPDATPPTRLPGQPRPARK